MKRSEQIVELMDDVKKIISQMAVVDVCEEEKPVEVGKTIMTSREVADMFQEYHSVTYRRIAQLPLTLRYTSARTASPPGTTHPSSLRQAARILHHHRADRPSGSYCICSVSFFQIRNCHIPLMRIVDRLK